MIARRHKPRRWSFKKLKPNKNGPKKEVTRRGQRQRPGLGRGLINRQPNELRWFAAGVLNPKIAVLAVRKTNART